MDNAPAPTEADFIASVRLALRYYHEPDRLRVSPLVHSRLVAAALAAAESPCTPVQALRDVLKAHCEQLGNAPKADELRRVIERTWLKPMRSQQAVAESLNLSWSTYRRRLASAVQSLATQLRDAENALARAELPAERRAATPALRAPARWRAPVVLGLAAVAAVGVVLWWVMSSASAPAIAGPSASLSAPVAATPAAQPPATGGELAAHDLYRVGMQYLGRRTPADIQAAIRYFRRAIKLRPDYAQAWSAAAMGYVVLRDYSDAPPDRYFVDALAAASKAESLHPNLSRPHSVLAYLYSEHWEWRKAADEFRLALKLDPKDPIAHKWYAMYLWVVGSNRVALHQMQVAHDLNPLSPTISEGLGEALQYAGKVDAAIAQLKSTTALAPTFALPHLDLAYSYRTKGLYRQELNEMRAAVSLTPKPTPAVYLSHLGVAYLDVGNRKLAKRQLARLEARARQHYVSGVALAKLHYALGDDAKAFAELADSVRGYDHHLLWVVVGQPGAWARDPRYQQILAGMHLPLSPTLAGDAAHSSPP